MRVIHCSHIKLCHWVTQVFHISLYYIPACSHFFYAILLIHIRQVFFSYIFVSEWSFHSVCHFFCTQNYTHDFVVCRLGRIEWKLFAASKSFFVVWGKARTVETWSLYFSTRVLEWINGEPANERCTRKNIYKNEKSYETRFSNFNFNCFFAFYV